MQQGEEMEHYRFILYVTGVTARTERAVVNLRRLCDEDLRGRYEPRSWTSSTDPMLPKRKILATPLLVKESPLPKRRITGDLSDARRVLHVLGLTAEPHPHRGDLHDLAAFQ
jgi:circadian clock protein KaiB